MRPARHIRRTPLCLVLATLLLAVAPARADRASALFSRGMRQFEAGRFQRSLALFRRALDRATTPQLAADIQKQLGINHAVLGDRLAARNAFASALRHDPLMDLDPEQHKPAIVEMFREIRAELRGYLEVRSDPAGATVLIDGKNAGVTPYRGSLHIGRHEIEVQAPDGGTPLLRASALVAPERTTRINAKPAPAPTLDPEPRARPQELAPGAATDHEPRPRRLWTWVAAGGAVVSGAIAIGLGVATNSDFDEYKSTRDPQRFDVLADRIPTRAAVANTMYVVAGTLAIASAVLYFFEPRWRARSSAAPVLGPDRVGLSLRHCF